MHADIVLVVAVKPIFDFDVGWQPASAVDNFDAFYPRAVKIELTSQCNYRCGFCAHRLRMKQRGEMDPAFFRRVVGEMVDAGVEELGVFYMGESFMCEWLPEAIAYAKERGMRYVFLTTNGSLATPARVSRCMRAGLDSLKFSMNNADEEQFGQIAGVKKKLFRDSVANLTSGTVYHYRVVATNSQGTTIGRDRQFKTAGQPPNGKVTTSGTVTVAGIYGNSTPPMVSFGV